MSDLEDPDGTREIAQPVFTEVDEPDLGRELAARMTAPAGAKSARPAIPDPRAIVAAAQAFTERARARLKGAAA